MSTCCLKQDTNLHPSDCKASVINTVPHNIHIAYPFVRLPNLSHSCKTTELETLEVQSVRLSVCLSIRPSVRPHIQTASDTLTPR
jgi:hypothetical protein